jgi:hypothetical protein
MSNYFIEARGYGGEGPSITPMIVSDLNAAKQEIADLIQTDHAVWLYKIDTNGTKTRMDFEIYTTVTVEIEDV